MQIIPPTHLFTVARIQAGPKTVPDTDQSPLSSASTGGLELDLIKIHSYTFDLMFIRQMQPQDNMPERMEWFCWHLQNNGQSNCGVMQGVCGY